MQPERALRSLQAFASANSELGRFFARSRRLHTTDATAIVEILTAEGRDRPLTPARLAERLALTTGATSILLNRLEAAGHIRRTRGHSDRRMVTLHTTAAVHETAGVFFGALAEQLEAALSGYTAAQLDLVEEVVTRLSATMTSYVDSVERPG